MLFATAFFGIAIVPAAIAQTTPENIAKRPAVDRFILRREEGFSRF